MSRSPRIYVQVTVQARRVKVEVRDVVDESIPPDEMVVHIEEALTASAQRAAERDRYDAEQAQAQAAGGRAGQRKSDPVWCGLLVRELFEYVNGSSLQLFPGHDLLSTERSLQQRAMWPR
ncbi:MAG: hypothetical protein WAW17_29815, partial [Rhodococcus sp. (in: high G+C Gram-positive bacteria)]|uniref:hypothetical protein n=1 Tax=Rhodococcus sp. TaxID=1831 RepID=UPI003BB2123C